jgi:hypothetical protein
LPGGARLTLYIEGVRFTVFDARARAPNPVAVEVLPAGDHFRDFDAGGLLSGTYFCHTEAGAHALTQSTWFVVRRASGKRAFFA